MHQWSSRWVLYPCRNNMLNFQFTMYQFRLTSHLSFISWGNRCLFWQDYHNVPTVEVCFLFLSIHICESTCFSPTLTLCLLLEWGSWCSRAGLSCVIAPVPLCWKCVCSQLQFPLPTDLPIDFLQSAKPPSLPLVLMHLGGSIPHIDQQTPVATETVAEVSAIDLPLTPSQLSYCQSILYRWFLSPYSYPVFSPFP